MTPILDCISKTNTEDEIYLTRNLSDKIIPSSSSEVTKYQLAEMDEPPTFERQGVFRFKDLPAEIRCKVYYFAIVDPHPLPLFARDPKTSDKVYVVEKDMRMINTNREFREETRQLPYSENSFSFSVRQHKPRKGAQQFRVDVKRIQKWYISVKKRREDNGLDYGDSIDDGLDFTKVVPTLAFEGHEMKYLLVECEPQFCENLADCLSPLSMLRGFRMVLFRSSQAQMCNYFRFLEGLMTSDRPVPFSNSTEFWEEFINTEDDDLLRQPHQSWLAKSLDVTTAAVEKSEAQIEDTAKELYSILGIERDFIPQSKMDETCPLWHVGKERTLSQEGN